MSEYNKNDFHTEDDGIEILDINYIDENNDEYDGHYDSHYGNQDSSSRRSTVSTPTQSRNTSAKNKPVSVVSEIISYVKIIVIAIVIAFVFTQYVIVNAQVPTGSMKNTIMEGDRLIGFRLAYVFSEPQRGDIVIFKFPDDESENYVKRIIGVPGDVIQITDGHVYVNGELSPESYIREAMIDTGTEQTYIVPEDSYFMLGDNRNSSKDSRYWVNTFVQRKKILAKVVFRYYDGENKRLDFSMIK